MNSTYRAFVGRLRAVRQSPDEPITGGLVRCLGDPLVPCREELLLLEFDALPWRVAEYAVEAAGPTGFRVDAGAVRRHPEDLRELQVPVEEPILRRQPIDLQVCVQR